MERWQEERIEILLEKGNQLQESGNQLQQQGNELLRQILAELKKQNPPETFNAMGPATMKLAT